MFLRVLHTVYSFSNLLDSPAMSTNSDSPPIHTFANEFGSPQRFHGVILSHLLH